MRRGRAECLGQETWARPTEARMTRTVLCWNWEGGSKIQGAEIDKWRKNSFPSHNGGSEKWGDDHPPYLLAMQAGPWLGMIPADPPLRGERLLGRETSSSSSEVVPTSPWMGARRVHASHGKGVPGQHCSRGTVFRADSVWEVKCSG